MWKAVIAACSIGLLLPVAAWAADIDYPALGIKLTALPDGAKTVYVQERVKGYEAQTSFGPNTRIQIFRFDAPVSDGNIADPAYRNALLTQAGIQPGSGGTQMLATVAGRAAWVVGGSQQLAPGMVAYYCNYYVVVSQHLYWIDISAFGSPKQANSNFDAAATNIATRLVFETVQPQPEKALAPGEMPPFLMGSSSWRYPDRARRVGEQGIVKLEFAIGGDGTAQGVKVASNDAGPDLAQVAISMLKDGGFKVPQGWQQSTSSFTMEWHFKLSCPRTGGSSPEDLDPRVITVCGSVL
jgi:TonB family protein